MSPVKAVPPGMHNVTPVMVIKGCAEAMELYKKAFGAEETGRAMDPSGKLIWHAAMRIGDSTIYMNDEIPGMGSPARPAQLWIYMENADRLFQRAVDAGCKVLMPMSDQFWGDRFGKVADKWGNEWSIAQRVREMTPEETKRAQDEFVAKMGKQ